METSLEMRVRDTRAANVKKRIAVIGAGPSGLVTLKELKEKGHDVVAFEARSRMGGAFTAVYADLQLTSSNLLTSFGTFVGGDAKRPDMWRADEYVAYLADYADRFGLTRHVHFGVRVASIQRDTTGAGWRLCVIPDEGDNDATGAAAQCEAAFDHVAICCGPNLRPHLPAWADAAKFRGRLCHSSEVCGETEFVGKRVLVVGLGESGSDLALIAARNADACGISSRSGPGYVIPRYYRGRPSDLDTNRCYHSLPRSVGGAPIVRFKTRIEDAMLHPDEDRAVLRKATEFNRERGLSGFHRFGTKNTSFVEAMVHHDATYWPDVVELDGKRAIFDDGRTFECDMIVCCTGYAAGFPFLERHEPSLAMRAADSRRLYKRMIIPETGVDIAWIGYVRPAIGSVQPCAEMQARHYAQLVSAERSLPSRERMQEDIRLHEELDRQQFPVDADRVATLTDYFRFMESMSEVIGCRPSLGRLFVVHPRTWFKVMFAPLSSAQFRLVGPGADPEGARAALRAMPTMPWPVLLYEGLLLAGCQLAGLARRTLVQHRRDRTPDAPRSSPAAPASIRPGGNAESRVMAETKPKPSRTSVVQSKDASEAEVST